VYGIHNKDIKITTVSKQHVIQRLWRQLLIASTCCGQISQLLTTSSALILALRCQSWNSENLECKYTIAMPKNREQSDPTKIVKNYSPFLKKMVHKNMLHHASTGPISVEVKRSRSSPRKPSACVGTTLRPVWTAPDWGVEAVSLSYLIVAYEPLGSLWWLNDIERRYWKSSF